MMLVQAKYVHTNLIACNWCTLAEFYQRVLGCVPVPPERDLSGEAMERATGIAGAHLCGVHLRLPGHGDGGPTLEIFQYDGQPEHLSPAINRPGYGHLAFRVDDVRTAREAVLSAGGRDYGEVVAVPVAGAGIVTFVYMTDPEGNLIELQQWTH